MDTPRLRIELWGEIGFGGWTQDWGHAWGFLPQEAPVWIRTFYSRKYGRVVQLLVGEQYREAK